MNTEVEGDIQDAMAKDPEGQFLCYYESAKYFASFRTMKVPSVSVLILQDDDLEELMYWTETKKAQGAPSGNMLVKVLASNKRLEHLKSLCE